MARRIGIGKLLHGALWAATATVLVFAFFGPGRATPATAGTTTKSTRCPVFGCTTTSLPPTTFHFPTTTSASTVPHSTTTTKTSRTTVPASTTVPVGSTFVTTPLVSTTTSSTTSTTIAAIGGHLPKSVQTLPLTTHGSNAHVDPVFAMLSGIGFFLALVIILGRFVISSPRWRRSST